LYRSRGVRCREIWGDLGRSGEVWGGLGRSGEIWGGLGRCRGGAGEVSGEVQGRCRGGVTSFAIELKHAVQILEGCLPCLVLVVLIRGIPWRRRVPLGGSWAMGGRW